MNPRSEIIAAFEAAIVPGTIRHHRMLSLTAIAGGFLLWAFLTIGAQFAPSVAVLLNGVGVACLVIGLVLVAVVTARQRSVLQRAFSMIRVEAPLLERLITPRFEVATDEITDAAGRRYCFAAALARAGLRLHTGPEPWLGSAGPGRSLSSKREANRFAMATLLHRNAANPRGA